MSAVEIEFHVHFEQTVLFLFEAAKFISTNNNIISHLFEISVNFFAVVELSEFQTFLVLPNKAVFFSPEHS